MFGSNSNTMSLDTFISNLSPYAIPDLGTWCNKCENTKTRGCDVIAAVNATDAPGSITSTRGKQDVSPVVAGVIGALLGIVVAVVFMIGGELLRRRRAKKTPYARGGSGGGAARESSFMGDSVSQRVRISVVPLIFSITRSNTSLLVLLLITRTVLCRISNGCCNGFYCTITSYTADMS
jgi:hypothetical protein